MSSDNGQKEWPSNVAVLPQADGSRQLRIIEALLFASAHPLSVKELGQHLPEDADAEKLLQELQHFYASRGVNLVEVAGKWAFRTADDLGFLLSHERIEEKRLSKAALETLAIIAYHQPVTRTEIEEVRGVTASKGTLNMLLEMDWIRIKGRRRSPGRPVTYGTTEAFLDHFGLESSADLPGMDELKAAGLLSSNVPASLGMSMPGAEDAPDLFTKDNEEE